VPLRIAFDLDGVLADMDGELVRQAEIVFGEAMTRRLQDVPAVPAAAGEASDATLINAGAKDEPQEAVPDAPGLAKLQMTARQQRRLWQHVRTIENFWGTLAPLEPGVIARLATLAGDRRWEVIFLTKRPACAGPTSQVQTQRWLEASGFPLPSVYVVQGSRGRIAASLDLDFVVDDRPENCLDVVVDSTARAILVWRDDERQLPAAAKRLGIGVVRSVDECLDILTQIDAPPAEKPGVADRVKRLLGLKS
jgi:hypothetical protein